jgi:hypothetical protein
MILLEQTTLLFYSTEEDTMHEERPPRKQRLITKHYRRDWYVKVNQLLSEGKSLEEIAIIFSNEVTPVVGSTLSKWMKKRMEDDAKTESEVAA